MAQITTLASVWTSPDRRRAARYFRGRYFPNDSIDVGRFNPGAGAVNCGAVRVIWRGLRTTVCIISSSPKPLRPTVSPLLATLFAKRVLITVSPVRSMRPLSSGLFIPPPISTGWTFCGSLPMRWSSFVMRYAIRALFIPIPRWRCPALIKITGDVWRRVSLLYQRSARGARRTNAGDYPFNGRRRYRYRRGGEKQALCFR